MTYSNSKKNIRIFCLYRFISRFYLYLPILAVILYNYKLSYIEISLILAAHGLSIMIFKTPLSSIRKKISSDKLIIFIGELLKSAGVLSLALSKGNVYMLIIGQVISGIGFSLTAGTDSGMLLKSMKAANNQDNYRKIEAKSQGIGFIAILISGIIGSIIAKTNNSLALYLTAPFSAMAAILILFFQEPSIEFSNNTASQSENKASIKASIKSVLNLLIYYALNRAVIMAIYVYLLPIFLLKSFNLDLSFFGAILGLFSLTGFLIGNNFEKVSSCFQKSQLWIIVPTALFSAVLLLALKNKIILLVVPILLGIASSIVRPLTMGKVNSIVKENNSFVMSKSEQFFGLFNSLFLILIGFLFKYFSLSNVLYILLAVMLILNMFLALIFKISIEKSNLKNQLENQSC